MTAVRRAALLVVTRAPTDGSALEFSFKPPERSGRVVFELENGHVAVGERELLDDVDLWLERGEHVSLVGPNGAGKTTTLRSLAGILRPTRGRLVIEGHDLAQAPVAAKKATAYIPDEPKLFDQLTVCCSVDLIIGDEIPYVSKLKAALFTVDVDAIPDRSSVPPNRANTLPSALPLLAFGDDYASDLLRRYEFAFSLRSVSEPFPFVHSRTSLLSCQREGDHQLGSPGR